MAMMPADSYLSVFVFREIRRSESMEIRNLITFLKAAEEQSFSRTASSLGYAQSTITMQIKQLEEELGVRLFDRIGKTILITTEGEKLREIASVIVRCAAEASHLGDPNVEIRGCLRIGLTESLQNRYMSDMIHIYHSLNPCSAMVVKAASVETLSYMLAHNQLDLIFICSERIRSAQMVTAWEKKEPVYFISSPHHPLQKKKKLSLQDLLNVTFLQAENDSSYGLSLGRYLADKGVMLSSYLDIGNPDIIIDLVRQNDGISFLPGYVIQKGRDSGFISVLPYDTSDIDVWIQLLYHKNKFLNASMRSFIEIIKKYLGDKKEH